MRGRRETLVLEPGRRLVADAGVLLTRVIACKPGDARSFAIVDAAMNDLLRPALYEAWHGIDAVRPRDGPAQSWDVVGPVCESADFLGHDRRLALAEGDLLAVRTAGAYGMAMSSNYNARPRAAEVLVDGASVHVARRRESHRRPFRERIAAAVIDERSRAVRKRNTSFAKCRNHRRNLANVQNVATMQAAGAKGFVKWRHGLAAER